MMDKKHTKYERAKIIGTRALQISQGAPFLLKIGDDELKALKYDPVAIAKKEFEAGVIPMDIIRPMPRKVSPNVEAEKVVVVN